jgi:hypothetical protein
MKTLSSSRIGTVIAGVLLLAVALDVDASPAQAASKRKVGLSLTGSPSSHVHAAISVVLKHHGFEVIPTELGGGSDDAVASAAKQSHLAAVVVGEVRDAGKRLKLRVYGASGDLIGEGSWSEHKGPKKLGAVVKRTLWARVGDSLSKARPAGADKTKADKDEASEAAEPKADEAQGEAAPTYSRSKDSDTAREPAGDETTEAPPKKKRHAHEEKDEAKDEAKAEPEEAEAPPGGVGPALELGAGPRFLWRSLSWNNDASKTLRAYSVAHAPSLGVSLALYPLAFVRGGWLANLGVAGSLEYTPGLTSQTSDGSSYPTTASDFWLGLRDRMTFGPVEGALTVGGGQQVFIFHSQGASNRANLDSLPDVKYSYLRLGLDLRIALPAHVSLLLGGGFRYVLGAGNVNYLLEASSYFPNASILAFEGLAGLGYRFLPMLEVRAGVDLRRYQITAGSGPTYMASGATDQYVGASAELVFYLDGASGAAAKTAPETPADEPAQSSTKSDKKKADKDADEGDDGSSPE